MNMDVLELTKELVAIKSVSRWSNREVSDFLEDVLNKCAFEVERLTYIDPNGEEKVSLVAKKGEGVGGLAFLSHSDTVPGQEQDWEAFNPVIKDGRLLGRGSCDMKGPLAATIIAAHRADAAQLKQPIVIAITADEEIGGGGAKQVATESLIFKGTQPQYGVIAEPTSLVPVYAHKGVGKVHATAHGKAAHTSTDLGISANFLIAPFFAEMADLAKRLKSDQSFMNHEFSPPTVGFNMVIDDGQCAANVTAAKTVCTVGFRPIPNAPNEDLMAIITQKAEKYGLEVESRLMQPFYISPDAKIIQVANQVTGLQQAQTVSYGTEAIVYKDYLDLVVLGPGNIAQAHTVGEWIDLQQLTRAVNVYSQMIETLLC
ncbi:MAG: M20/M25/M40 family metallo-hydrolase [Ardenticatenaceae bacterium]